MSVANCDIGLIGLVAELAAGLKRPRRAMSVVKAGEAVDRTIDALTPHLEPGDILKALAEREILVTGTGMSGGEEGARHGLDLSAGELTEVFSRSLSAMKADRLEASKLFSGPAKPAARPGRRTFFDDVRRAVVSAIEPGVPTPVCSAPILTSVRISRGASTSIRIGRGATVAFHPLLTTLRF